MEAVRGLSRRGFFGGLAGSLVAAPAIVRASSLMKVRPLDPMLTKWGQSYELRYRGLPLVFDATDADLPMIILLEKRIRDVEAAVFGTKEYLLAAVVSSQSPGLLQLF